MAAKCPYCEHQLRSASARAGRFRVRCPACAKTVSLTIPADPAGEWLAKPMTEIASVRDTMARPRPQGTGAVRLAVEQTQVVSSQDTGAHVLDTPAPRKSAPPRPASSIPDQGTRIGEDSPPTHPLPGYRIEKVIGRGGMGSVYLAKQLSLDRPVAVKVMSRRWADDPVFVARFTREAYAAALLNHPNAVQIYDIGEVDRTRFFSMEYVPGRSLAEVVRTEGKLDPETAVGYILQAARGLKHAHDRGMIHRDVKPDNLLLDEQGIVKIADLGLVKTPTMSRVDDRTSGSSGLHELPPAMTGVRIALGTPAYMAPEQCRDSAAVDHRADIYSLGCTLYVLVTGRPPFDGASAIEVMTKHAYEPLVPPEAIVSRLPKELSVIIQRMMAKEPGDRFAHMGDVIRTLEQWLGVHSAGTFHPREEQIEQLEQIVHQFHEAPAAVQRNRVLAGGVSVALLAAVLLTFFGHLGWAFGMATLVISTAIAHFVIDGLANRTYLFRRMRQFLFGLSLGDWAVLVAGGGLFVLLLGMLGLFWIGAGCALAGVGAGLAIRYGFDRRIEAERKAALDACERQLRRMRRNGVDEEQLRQFVAKYAGRHWEEFFESIFGYEAKLAARALILRGGMAGVREKHAAWREPILSLIDRAEKSRKESRERKLLARVEQERLLATGESAERAADRAAQAAAQLVQQAGAIRSGRQAVNLGQLAGSNPFDFREPEPRPSPLGGVVNLFVGPHVRAAIAAFLLAACTLWVQQNHLFNRADYQAATRAATEAVETGQVGELPPVEIDRSTVPLKIDGIPDELTSWCDSANVGVAGVLVLASLFYRGKRMAILVLLGAAVAVLGVRFGIRTVEPIQGNHVALLLGTVLSLIGYRLGRA